MDRKIGLGVEFAVALGIAVPALAQQAGQLRVEDGGNGHWHQERSSSLATWEDCRSFSESIRAHLVKTTSFREQAVVASLVAFSGGNHWIDGLASAWHGWRWVTSEPWTLEDGMYDDRAGGGEPIPCDGGIQQDFLAIEQGGIWNDTNHPGFPECACFTDMNWLRAIIERSGDCSGGGSVDCGPFLQDRLANASDLAIALGAGGNSTGRMGGDHD